MVEFDSKSSKKYKCLFLINPAALVSIGCGFAQKFLSFLISISTTTCQRHHHCWVSGPAERQRRIYERLEASQVTSCVSRGALQVRIIIHHLLSLAMNGSCTYHILFNNIDSHNHTWVLHDFFQVESHKGIQVHIKCKNVQPHTFPVGFPLAIAGPSVCVCVSSFEACAE